METFSTGSQARFKTSMLKSSLYDYSDAYILVSGPITIIAGPEDATPANKKTEERCKGLIFKNCAPLIECTSKINITQIDYAKDLDVVMPMYN